MNKAYFDYLRLATWDTAEYASVLSKLYTEESFLPYKWLQYRGKRSKDGRIFHGLGSQGRGKLERRHAVVQFSGTAAQEWRRTACTWDGFYCTRLDVQVTIAEPPEHDAELLYSRLNRKAKQIIRQPGNATVYIGARTSPLFTRIYEKLVDGTRYLRCEFELKQAYAKRAWESYKSGETSSAEIFATLHERAKIPSPWAEWFAIGADTYEELLQGQEAQDLRNKLVWIHDTETALERAFYEHQTHGAVAAMIERLNDMRHLENGER